MDEFLSPFWNLDQIRGWAVTRDPDVVRFAGSVSGRGQSESASLIEIRAVVSASRSKQAGRNVNVELWDASGWPMPPSPYVAPRMLELLAERLNVPVFQIANDASLDVRLPRCPRTEALLVGWSRASPSERDALSKLFFRGAREHESDLLEATEMQSLSSELRGLVAAYIQRREVQGPPQVIRLPIFPIEDYLLTLFRSARVISRMCGLTETPFCVSSQSAGQP